MQGRFRQAGRVTFKLIFSLVMALAILTGCKKAPVKDQSPVAPPEPVLPTAAQPRLATMKLYLGREILEAELARTPKEVETGMMYRTNIQDTDAMLFIFQQPFRASFWMTNCPESISAAYIGPDGTIEEIHHLEKNDNVPVVATNDNIQFVLETSEGWFTRHHINPGTIIRTEQGSLTDTFFRR